MTRQPAPSACRHCGTVPVAKHIATQPVPVTLALCDCDHPHCPHPACRKIMRNLPIGVHRCPHCGGSL